MPASKNIRKPVKKSKNKAAIVAHNGAERMAKPLHFAYSIAAIACVLLSSYLFFTGRQNDAKFGLAMILLFVGVVTLIYQQLNTVKRSVGKKAKN